MITLPSSPVTSQRESSVYRPQLLYLAGVQTFHHLPFIHPTVNHGHLINGLGLGLGFGLGLALAMRSHRRLITVKFYHRDTLARS